MNEKMFLCGIMPLNIEYVDEICQDIRYQVENGIINYPMFMTQLVPEGIPPKDKASEEVEKYVIFRDKLRAMGIKSGILIQCSIGHGYPLNAPNPFVKYVNLNDGKEEHVCCPYDDKFCEHFKGVMSILAKAEPDILMLDDDFRLMFRGGNGCACSLHMERFNQLANTSLTREELFNHLKNDNDGEYAKIYLKTQAEALLKAARAMREGIDAVNPSLTCVLCAAGNNAECAIEISQILAGEGNEPIVRVSNGSYVPAGTRFFTRDFYRAAIQIANLEGVAKNVLAESDTCPQNRYACSAQWFHSHYVGSILEGTSGAKHWITRLGTYEPESGVAYRKILAKFAKFYERLVEIVPNLQWKGCRIPLNTKKRYFFSEDGWSSNNDNAEGWATHVLERIGLPIYFSKEDGGLTFLSGEIDKKYSDDEILELLKRPIVLSSNVAKRLCDRGFSKQLGVEIKEWEGALPSRERLFVNNQTCEAQVRCKEIVAINNDVEILSKVYNVVGATETELFPGSTLYKNELGGTAVVFAGDPITAFNYVEAFSFLTHSRKLQFIKILRKCGVLDVYYQGDEEIYCKHAKMKDGSDFCAIFNLSYDVIDNINLYIDKQVKGVQVLQSNGEICEVAYKQIDKNLAIDMRLLPLDPQIFIIK